MIPPIVRFSSPDTVTPPYGAYSHVATVSAQAELVFLSGQVGERPDGTLPDTIEAQYLQTITTIAAILEAEGLSPQNIVKLSTYVTRPIDGAKLRAMRESVFGDIKPAATMLYVPRLLSEAYFVEIEVIAARG